MTYRYSDKEWRDRVPYMAAEMGFDDSADLTGITQEEAADMLRDGSREWYEEVKQDLDYYHHMDMPNRHNDLKDWHLNAFYDSLAITSSDAFGDRMISSYKMIDECRSYEEAAKKGGLLAMTVYDTRDFSTLMKIDEYGIITQ